MKYRNADCVIYRSISKAMGTPIAEASNASLGDPFLLSRPKAGGAHPRRASENNIRLAEYNAAFDAESAAVSTTRFISVDAAGTPATTNTVTNGLCPTPARLQGSTPTSMAVAPM